MQNNYQNNFDDYKLKISKIEEQQKLLNDYKDVNEQNNKEEKKKSLFQKLFGKKRKNNELEK